MEHRNQEIRRQLEVERSRREHDMARRMQQEIRERENRYGVEGIMVCRKRNRYGMDGIRL